MEYRILGPLEVIDAEGAVDLGRGRAAALLSALVLRAGHDVSAEALAEVVWEGGEPNSWRKSLQMHVLRLRERIGPARIETTPRGYRLVTDASEIDGARFAAALASHPNGIDGILAMWRGRPYDDLDEWPPAVAARGALLELHADAIDLQMAGRTRSGSPPIAEIERLVEAEPEREHRWALLMFALYRTGRQAEALRAFERARSRLTEEFGVEPGPRLVALHRAILDQDPRLDAAEIDLGVMGLGESASVPAAVLDHRRRAGNLRAENDAEGALRELEAALRAAVEHGCDARVSADLELEVADAARAAGDPARAVEAAESAATLARLLDDAPRLARAALAIGGDGWLTGVDPEAGPLGLLDEALARLGSAPSPLRARVLARLAVVESHNRPVVVADRHSRESLALASVLGDPEATALALHARLVVDQDIAHLVEREAAAHDLVALATTCDEPRWRAWAIPPLARVRAQHGDVEGAIALLADLDRSARRDGDPVARYHATSRHVLAATVAGDTEAAVQAAAAVRDAGTLALMDPTAAAVAYYGTVGILKILDGTATIDAFGADIAWPQETMEAAFQASIALRTVQTGDLPTARQAIGPLTPARLTGLPRDLYWPSMVWMMSATVAALSDRERAEALWGVAAPFADAYVVDGAMTFLGSMQHHLGLLAATAGDRDRAGDYLDAAIEAHQRVHAAGWLARSVRARDQLAAATVPSGSATG